VLGVTATEVRRLPALLQFFTRELPDRLKHSVAQPTPSLRLGQRERFVHERRQQIQHEVSIDRITHPDGLGGLEIPTPDERG
jgi:hypothetical protein